MGIADRDYYRDHLRDLRRGRSARRRSGALRIALIWIALLAALIVGFQWWSRTQSARVPPSGSRASQTESTRTGPPNGAGAQLPPSPPIAVQPATPPTTSIYRCGNAYSTVACAGGHIVAPPAASGFDSRPSEQLSQLDAQGRAANLGSSNAPQTVTTTMNVAASNGSCAQLAADIEAIDRAARSPLPMSVQDRLRAQRRNDRDQQLRQHC